MQPVGPSGRPPTLCDPGGLCHHAERAVGGQGCGRRGGGRPHLPAGQGEPQAVGQAAGPVMVHELGQAGEGRSVAEVQPARLPPDPVVPHGLPVPHWSGGPRVNRRVRPWAPPREEPGEGKGAREGMPHRARRHPGPGPQWQATQPGRACTLLGVPWGRPRHRGQREGTSQRGQAPCTQREG